MDSGGSSLPGSYPDDPSGSRQPDLPPVADHVVVVASGKGGVGKSTISLNLALAIAEQGVAVGLLDADVHAPDIPLMLNLTRTKPRKLWPMFRNPSLEPLRFEPVDRFGLKVMSAGFLLGEDQALSLPATSINFVLNQLARQVAWGKLDYLVVDLPPGTADVQQHIVGLLRPSGALIVVTPQDLAHLDAKKVISMFADAGVPILGGVENMHGLVCPHCHTQLEILPSVRDSRAIWATGIEKLGELPLDPELAQLAEQGRPLLIAKPDHPQAEQFRKIGANVATALGTP